MVERYSVVGSLDVGVSVKSTVFVESLVESEKVNVVALVVGHSSPTHGTVGNVRFVVTLVVWGTQVDEGGDSVGHWSPTQGTVGTNLVVASVGHSVS